LKNNPNIWKVSWKNIVFPIFPTEWKNKPNVPVSTNQVIMGKSLESWDFSAPFLGQLLMAKRAAEYRQLWESKLGN